jgi:hypothetical protein
VKITAVKAAEILTATEGKIFSVKFVKRTTGEIREMVARTGVKAHLKGGDAAYKFSDKGLVSVYDIQAKGYRTIALEGIVSLKSGGEVYEVEG